MSLYGATLALRGCGRSGSRNIPRRARRVAVPTSGDAETTGKVGEAVTNAGTTYEVTHVQDTDTIGDPDLLGARAAGTFVARQ
jgi:hypothetical protein